MSRLSAVLRIYSQLIGLASSMYMGFAFFVMAILHKGVLFYEPNIAIATLELGMCVSGVILLWLFALKEYWFPEGLKGRGTKD